MQNIILLPIWECLQQKNNQGQNINSDLLQQIIELHSPAICVFLIDQGPDRYFSESRLTAAGYIHFHYFDEGRIKFGCVKCSQVLNELRRIRGVQQIFLQIDRRFFQDLSHRDLFLYDSSYRNLYYRLDINKVIRKVSALYNLFSAQWGLVASDYCLNRPDDNLMLGRSWVRSLELQYHDFLGKNRGGSADYDELVVCDIDNTLWDPSVSCLNVSVIDLLQHLCDINPHRIINFYPLTSRLSPGLLEYRKQHYNIAYYHSETDQNRASS